jgi:cytochrome c
MKNYFLQQFCSPLTSCSEKKRQNNSNRIQYNDGEPKPAASADTASTTAAAKPEDEGKALVEGADCLSCHKVDSKLVDRLIRT